jgi:hypothetical protein
MNVAFVKVKLGLLALLKIRRIIKSDFAFFVERSAPDHCFKEFLSVFLIVSGVEFGFLVNLFKEFFLKFAHGIIIILNFNEIHGKTAIFILCIVYFFVMYGSPKLFYVFWSYILIFIGSVLGKVLERGLSSFGIYLLMF